MILLLHIFVFLSDYKIKQVIILKPNPPAFAHSAKLHEQKQGDKFINNVVKLYTWIQIVEKWIDSITRQSNYDKAMPSKKMTAHTKHRLIVLP